VHHLHPQHHRAVQVVGDPGNQSAAGAVQTGMTHRAARPFGSFGSLVAGSVAGPPAASRRRTPAGSRLPGLVAGLLAAAVLPGAGWRATGGERAGVGAVRDRFVAAGAFRLVAYNSCEEAAERLRAATREYVSPWGLGGDMLAVEDGAAAAGDGRAAPERAMAPEQAAVPAPAGAAAPAREPAPDPAVDPAAPQHSGTNVHEAGVDEPDLVKTDGRRIVTVNRGVLRVVDAAT